MKIEDDRIEIRKGGGCLAVFGLPFLLAGCSVLVAAVSGKIEGLPVIGGVLFGLVFAAVGALFVFGRGGLEIDARSGTYRKWYSLLMLTKETTGTLDAFDKVVIDQEVRHSKNSTYTVYPIRLVGQDAKVDIDQPLDEDIARTQGEKIAKALKLPLADRTGPEEVVRDADHLDESLREHRRRTGEPPSELPSPPSQIKTTIRAEGKEMVLEIPPSGLTPGTLVYLLPPAIFVTFVSLFFLGPFLHDFEKMPKPFFFVFAGFVGVFFVLLPICMGAGMFLRATRTRHTVRVSPRRLRVTTHGVVRMRHTDIPADELEELRITSTQGRNIATSKEEIVARSDRATVKFGGHLSPQEKQWIKAVLGYVLTA